MRGYKIFGPDYTCKGYKYSLESTNFYDKSIKPCETGFHFCRYARDCMKYYQIDDTNNTYAIVESGDNYITKNDKVICDRLVIVKTLTKDEFLHYVNNGEYKEWHDNGKLKVETIFVDGKLHGSYKTWYVNGQLEIETTWINGIPHNSCKKWYDNGQQEIEATYINGKINGSYKKWNRNGKLSMEITYENGNLYGKYKSWYPNGQLEIRTIYVNGKRHGIYKKWRDNGQLWIETNYVKGNVHGSYKIWLPNGLLIKTSYVHGREESSKNNGKIKQ